MSNDEIYFPKTGGYFDKALQRYFYSKEEKRKFMNEHKLAEAGDTEETVRASNKRQMEFVEEERRKQGLKPRATGKIFGVGDIPWKK